VSEELQANRSSKKAKHNAILIHENTICLLLPEVTVGLSGPEALFILSMPNGFNL